jgi:hypothetical protein
MPDTAEVFAGPSMNLSRLKTMLSLLTDYLTENTWQSPKDASARAAAELIEKKGEL